jgi:hypothetical protein
MKKPSNLKIVPKAESKFLFRLPFLLLVNFYSVYSLLDEGKCIFNWRLSEQFSGSQAAFGTVVFIGGYQKAGTSSLKSVSARVFSISKGFHRKLAKTLSLTSSQPVPRNRNNFLP